LKQRWKFFILREFFLNQRKWASGTSDLGFLPFSPTKVLGPVRKFSAALLARRAKEDET
jgi:hypothetical protein